MIKACDFLTPAREHGYNFWTGVPCSFLSPFINSVIQDSSLDYIAASSEGEAVGIAAGAHLAGRKTVVLCQNSGLCNTVNPLVSLNFPFRVPTLVITTLRGAPDIEDEPQHELMGQITGDLFDALKIPWEVFPKDSGLVEEALSRADETMNTTGLPFGLVMHKGTVERQELKTQTKPSKREACEVLGHFGAPGEGLMPRQKAIADTRLLLGDQAAFVATTGKIGRELFANGHRDNQLYVVGSMGCASGIGFGLHEASCGRRKVVVLDGDGAALMKMGALGTIGHYEPKEFTHIILDNESYDSTGGQSTVSSTVDFAAIAAACGYRNCFRADNPDDYVDVLKNVSRLEGPNLAHVKVAKGADKSLPRPDMTPVQVKQQFMNWYAS